MEERPWNVKGYCMGNVVRECAGRVRGMVWQKESRSLASHDWAFQGGF
jgi:hypothetical protein